MMNDMRCGGAPYAVFFRLFSIWLDRSSKRSEWAKFCRDPDSRLCFGGLWWCKSEQGDQAWVCTLLLLQRESPKYQLTHIQKTVALNWMRHWACNFGMCLSEVDWEETREVSPHAASDEYCQTRIVICTLCTGHLCYPGLVWTLQVTTAPATGLLSSQQWHIFQISKWSYWIICNLNWEKPTARGGLLEFITKMSVTHISWTWHPARVTQGCCENAAILIIADTAPDLIGSGVMNPGHQDHCHLVLTTQLPGLQIVWNSDVWLWIKSVRMWLRDQVLMRVSSDQVIRVYQWQWIGPRHIYI